MQERVVSSVGEPCLCDLFRGNADKLFGDNVYMKGLRRVLPGLYLIAGSSKGVWRLWGAIDTTLGLRQSPVSTSAITGLGTAVYSAQAQSFT